MPNKTTRECLDVLVNDMRAYAAQCDAKGGPTAAEAARLNQMADEVFALTDAVKAQRIQYGSSTSLSNDLPSQLLAGLGGSKAATSGGAKDAPGYAEVAAPLGFAVRDLAELHKGALARHITAKDAITVTDAPMAGVASYELDPFPWLRDRQRILDLIPTETTTSSTIHYFTATAAASAADTVEPGATKPYSEPHWTEATAPVKKVAHYTRVNDEVIADFDRFLDVVGTEMLAGLVDAENAQLLNGSGVSPDIEGLLVNGDISTIGSAGTDLDAVAQAANVVRTTAYVEPDTVVIHPNDWASTGFQLAKDSTGADLLGNPLTSTRLSLFGMTVVLTTAMTENTLMVANLKAAAKAYVRQAPTLEVAPYGGGTDEWTRNQTLIRAEERLALAIQRPAAICLVTAA